MYHSSFNKNILFIFINIKDFITIYTFLPYTCSLHCHNKFYNTLLQYNHVNHMYNVYNYFIQIYHLVFHMKNKFFRSNSLSLIFSWLRSFHHLFILGVTLYTPYPMKNTLLIIRPTFATFLQFIIISSDSIEIFSVGFFPLFYQPVSLKNLLRLSLLPMTVQHIFLLVLRKFHFELL